MKKVLIVSSLICLMFVTGCRCCKKDSCCNPPTQQYNQPVYNP